MEEMMTDIKLGDGEECDEAQRKLYESICRIRVMARDDVQSLYPHDRTPDYIYDLIIVRVLYIWYQVHERGTSK